MTVEELANKRYGGEFVFMLGHLEGVTRFVFCSNMMAIHQMKPPTDLNSILIKRSQV